MAAVKVTRPSPRRSGSRRQRSQRTAHEPGPVTVTYSCPTCSSSLSAPVDGSARGLRALHTATLQELGHALRDGAEDTHLRRVATLVADIERRLDALDADG